MEVQYKPDIQEEKKTTKKSPLPNKPVIVLGVLVVLLIALSFFLFSKIQKLTIREANLEEGIVNTHRRIEEIILNLENWRLYESDKYPFTFLYRSDISVEEFDDRTSFRDLYFFYFSGFDDFLFYTFITTETNVWNYSPEEYVQKILCDNKYTKYTDSQDYCQKIANNNLKEFNINGIKGVKTKYNYYENPSTIYIFNYDDDIITIRSTGETGGDASELAISTIELMISTITPKK